MLKNKIVVRKVRNIVILLMAILIMIGAYKNIDKSLAENVVEIGAIAMDKYGCLENEEFALEAKEISDGLYEIEIPENINTKQVNQVIEVTLENKIQSDSSEEIETIEITDNKIYLTTEQIENNKIKFKTVYDVAITVIDEQGKYSKDLLSEMTEEEITEVRTMTEGMGLLYNRTLKYEENEKIIEVKGYMLEDVELDIQEVTQEQLSETYGGIQVNSAYNIKTIRKVENEGEQGTTTEIIQINPLDYGEVFEVLITDSKIQKNSDVYYLKDKDTCNQVEVNESAAGNIKFNMYYTGIYGVKQQKLSLFAETTIKDNLTNLELNTQGTENVSTQVTGDENVVATESNGNSFARLYFSPASGEWIHNVNSYSISIGVKKYLSAYSNQSRMVEYVYWSQNTNTPTTWNTVEIKSTESSTHNYFSSPGNGVWYLHVKTKEGNTYYGGPYKFTQSDSKGPGIDAGVQSSSVLNFSNTTVNINATNGGKLTNSSVRAKWVDASIGRVVESDIDEYSPKDVSSISDTTRKHGVGIPNPTYGTDAEGNVIVTSYPEGEYVLQYKYYATTEQGAAVIGYSNSPSISYFDKQGPRIQYSQINDYVPGIQGTLYKWYNTDVSMHLVISDGWTKVQKLEWSEDGENWYEPPLFDAGDVEAGVYGETLSWTHKLTEERALSNVYYRATDRVGNVGKIFTHELGIDKTKPTVSVNTSSDTNYTQTKDIIITANDERSGVDDTKTSYQYYLSTSSTSLSGGEWKDYTNGETTTIGEGLTGEYYLFIKPVTDQAGNKSTTSYHTFGPYNFDNIKPTVTIEQTSETKTWYNSAVTTKITVVDTGGSGLSTSNSYQWYLSKSATTLNTGDWTGDTWTTYTRGTAFNINPGKDGTYYLFVKRINDNAGNVSTSNGTDQTVNSVTYHRYGPYNFDYTKPSVAIEQTSETKTWYNSGVTTKIYVLETGGSGLLTGNSYQWYLSNSATALNTGEWTGDTWTTYTRGTAFNINPGKDGTYYLFVKRINDNAGNVSTSNGTDQTVNSVTYHRYGPYNFDYTKPSVTIEQTSETKTWYNSAVTTKINVSDTGGSGLLTGNSYQWYLSNSATSLNTGDWTGDTWTTYTRGTAFNINPEKDGTYYLFVKRVNDNAGNVSTSNGTNKTVNSVTYHRYGPYNFDYTKPSVTIEQTSETKTWYNSAVTTKINVSDTGGSGLLTGNSYQWYLSNSATSLNTGDWTGDTWTTYISGTEFPINPGEDGEYYLFVKTVNDNAGNISTSNGTNQTINSVIYHRYGPYNFDYTKPTSGTLNMKLENSDGENYINDKWTNKKVYIEVVDGKDEGIYQSGHKETLATIKKDGVTYLENIASYTLTEEGIYEITVKTTDKAGNQSDSSEIYTVKIDKTQPFSGTLNMKLEGPTGNDYTKNDWTNKNVYIEPVKGDDQGIYQSGSKTAIIEKIKKNGETYLENITSYTLTEEGTYEITVKTIDDAGNKSNSSEIYTVNIDTTKPVWTYVDKDIYYSTLNDVGNDNYANKERKVKIIFKGTDSGGSGIDETVLLNSSDINISVKLDNETTVFTVPESNKQLDYVISANEITYTLIVTGIEGDGVLTIAIPEGTLQDNAENINVAKSLTTDVNIDIDNTNPNLVLDVTTPAGTYNADKKIIITATYNENIYKEITSNTLITTPDDVNGELDEFGNPRVQVMTIVFEDEEGNRTSSKGEVLCTAVNGNILTYEYTIQPADNAEGTNGDNGTLRIESLKAVYDAAGNVINEIPENQKTSNIIADTIHPTIMSITPDKTSPTNEETITYTVEFSEDVFGFDVNDIDVNDIDENGSKVNTEDIGQTISISGSGKIYYVTITTINEAEYKETITIKSDACVDVAGNLNRGATSSEIVVDRIEPTLIITADKESPTNAEKIIYTFTFSEPVDGFDIDDIKINNELSEKTSELIEVEEPGVETKTKYTLEVSTVDNNTYTEIITVPEKSVTDQAGNENAPATSSEILIDRIDPTITVEPSSSTWTNTEISVKVTHNDDEGGSGITSESGQYFITTNESPNSTGTLSNYTSGTSFTINPGVSGEYYLYIKEISDYVGNESNTSDYVKINEVTYHKYGKYQFDYEKPIIEKVNSSKDSSNKTETIIFKVTDSLSGIANNIDANNVIVKIDGEETTAIVKPETTEEQEANKDSIWMELTSSQVTSNETTYTLILSNFEQSTKIGEKMYKEWSGNVSIEIPENTIQDNAGNTSNEITIEGDFIDFIKPVIEKVSSENNVDGTNTQTIIFNVIDKYLNTSDLITLNEDKDGDGNADSELIVKIDGQEADITKTLSIVSKFVMNKETKVITAQTKDYVVQSTEQVIGQQYKLVLSDFEKTRPSGKYYKEWSGDVSIEILQDAVKDTSENQNDETIIDGKFADFIKPEFTYEYSETIIGDGNHIGDKTLTVVFYAADKHFDFSNSSLQLSDLTVTVGGQEIVVNNVTETDINKKNTLTAENLADGTGIKYTLVIKNLEQDPNDGYSYSGSVSITIPEGKIKDTNITTPNSNGIKTITIGIDAPSTGDGDDSAVIVDVVDPIWKVVNLTTGTNAQGRTTAEIELIATDKYFSSVKNTRNELEGLIEIQVAGTDISDEAEEVIKTLSEPTYINWNNVNGTYTTVEEAQANGVKYTLTIENLEETYEAFLSARSNNERVYREYSGPTSIVIPAGTIEDDYGNVSKRFEHNLNHIDTLRPEVVKISSQIIKDETNIENSKQQIVFDITDKYFNTSAISTSDTSKIHVYVDGVETTNATKTITNITELKAIVDDVERIVGYRYTLELSNFKQTRTSISSNITDTTGTYGDFTELSGTVSIKIDANTVTDKNPITNEIVNGNVETEILGDFVDFIRPDVTYKYWGTTIDTVPSTSPDIDYTNKEFKMVFDLTDKYFDTNTLTAGMTREQLAQYITIMLAGTDITTNPDIDITIVAVEDVKAKGTINKTTDTVVNRVTTTSNPVTIDTISNEIIAETITTAGKTHEQVLQEKVVQSEIIKQVTDPVIGKRITLLFENLEQETITSEEYLDYSGVISVVIKDGTIVDKSDNTNLAETTTLVSGVDKPNDGTGTNTGTVVDVVDPLWQQAGSVTGKAIEQTATIPIRVTDKYIKKDASGKLVSELQSSDITVKVNGEVKGSDDGISVSVVQDTSTTLTYGKQYKVTVTGFAKDATQVSITLRQGIVLDESGNGNKETTFILFSSLKETNTETSENSGFLGNTSIQRQNIEKIIFQNNLNGINDTKWKASAQDDESIMAWYETRTVNGTTLYTVYIGSNVLMNANPDSSYLFSYIGYNSNCVSTSTSNPLIENIDLLNVGSVTNMARMFQYFGHKTMSSLSLGIGFDTTNVTNMSNMFKQCGYTAMTTIDLGANFNTSNVIDFSYMFDSCGETAMSRLDLGENFDTSSGTNMDLMFEQCGKYALIELDLGDKFNTSNVTSMKAMFDSCGMYSLTKLNLGDKFDTSKVTNMERMFKTIGPNTLNALDLGDKFYTTNVINMYQMFKTWDEGGMYVLDLGPAFTRIPEGILDDGSGKKAYAEMFDFGKPGSKIYASEAIYSDMKNFKTNATATEGNVSLANGKINLIYKPEWEKVSSTLDKSAGNLTVVVKGSANKEFTNGITYTGIYTSDVTSDLTANQITVYVDGELAEGIDASDITVSTVSTSTNATTNKTEVQYTITISNLEQAVRVAGKNFKEWSGNVELQFAKGTLIDTYGSYIGEDEEGNPIVVKDVSKDASGNIIANQNLAVIDIDTAGTTENIVVEDTTKLTANTETTEANMFADLIKPEFTYTYSESDINHDNESVTVVFDVTDKYFESTTLSSLDASQITVRVADYDTTTLNNAISKQLTKTATLVMNKTTKVITVESASYTVTSEERIIGERYQLVVTDLDQEDENGVGDGFKFSGHMSLAFNSGVITDKSGNTSDATTITIGLNENDGEPNDDTIHGSGVIVDVVDPVWQLGNISLDEGIIKLNAIDKYFGSVTIDEDDILVYVNGYLDGDTNKNGVLDEGETPNVTKDITSTTPEDIDNGKQYTLKLSNITTGGSDVTFTPYNVDELNSTAGFKYGDENGGNISIKILSGTIADQYGNTSVDQSFEIGNIDATKPRVYPVQNIQNASAGTETIIFNVTDRNYDSTDLITLDVDKNGDGVVDPEITVWLDGNQIDDEVIKQLTYKTIYLDADTIVGHQYTLVLSEIVETDVEYAASGREYRELSGTIEIRIAQNAVKDIKGNTLNETAKISDYIDYIKPELKELEVDNPVNTIDDANTYTVSFEIRDKYLDDTSEDTLKVQEDEIKVYVDGVLAPTIKKPTTVEEEENNKDKIWLEIVNPDNPEDPQPKPITATFNKTTVNGIKNGTYVVGHDYVLVLSNFEQSVKQSGKSFIEWSGTVKIVVDQDAVNDKNGQTGGIINILDSDETKRTVGGAHVDFIKPVVENISSTRGTNTETIVFDVIDKYIVDDDEATPKVQEGEINVYIDEEIVTTIAKPETTEEQENNKDKIWMELESTPITDTFNKTINGTTENGTYVVGDRYTLVLSNFEQSSRNAKGYKDWSGTIRIEIDEGAVSDIEKTNPDGQIVGGNENKETTKVLDFVDFIKPDIKYTHQSTDISKGTKSYTMTFDITDKYYTSGQLDLDDLTIKMQNGQIDSNENAIIYDLKTLATQGKINIAFNAVPYYAEPNIKITNTSGTVQEITTSNTHQIGHTYTLTISKLEKFEIETGLTTVDYSGIVTVAINGDVIQDRGPSGNGTNPNGNTSKTITSVVHLTGGTTQVVDVVKPIFERVSSSADVINETAEITFKVTDTYFVANSTISVNDIQVYVNGEIVNLSSTDKVLSEGTKLTEQRIQNYAERIEDNELEKQTTTVQYGTQYTLTLKGFKQDLEDDNEEEEVLNQIKIKIPAGKITDQNENSNVETDLIIYNILKSSANINSADEPFLGESSGTTIYSTGSIQDTIERQEIEKVEFVDNLKGLIDGDMPEVWDKLVKEWNIKDGIQKVWDVSVQGDFSILAWTKETDAPYTVYVGSNYEIFGNPNSKNLFAHIGAGEDCDDIDVITRIDLLNTRNVTNMSGMFHRTGHTAMKELDLGDKFNTSNVTDMSKMFQMTGYTAMQKLDLGEMFDTKKVTNMNAMFDTAGRSEMEILNLGNKFDTSAVTDMSYMFTYCGKNKMKYIYFGNETGTEYEIIFADSFKTSAVTDMSYMFNGFGYKKVKKLDLGNNFDTGNVTKMINMFQETGYESMQSLDLGEKFNTIKVTDMTCMFDATGRTSMTRLDLGENFDTSNVTKMQNMFSYCGKEAMTSLDLGNKFDTRKVTNMSSMFEGTGQTAMTSLDLGDKFYTTSATNMTNMFAYCGKTAMTVLDLGPAFTKIAEINTGMFTSCGTTGLKIYAPESIYSNRTAFK